MSDMLALDNDNDFLYNSYLFLSSLFSLDHNRLLFITTHLHLGFNPLLQLKMNDFDFFLLNINPSLKKSINHSIVIVTIMINKNNL